MFNEGNNNIAEMHHQDTRCENIDDIVNIIKNSNDVDKLKKKRKKLKKKIKKLKERKEFGELSKKEKHKLKELKCQFVALKHKQQDMVPKQIYEYIMCENQQLHKDKMFMAMVILDHHPDKEDIIRNLSSHVIQDELNCSKTIKLPVNLSVNVNRQQPLCIEDKMGGI